MIYNCGAQMSIESEFSSKKIKMFSSQTYTIYIDKVNYKKKKKNS